MGRRLAANGRHWRPQLLSAEQEDPVASGLPGWDGVGLSILPQDPRRLPMCPVRPQDGHSREYTTERQAKGGSL